MHTLKLSIFFLLLCSTTFGQINFFKTYSDHGYDVGEGIVQLEDSSYLVTGSSSSFQDNNQAFILKVDSLGNRLWSKNFGGAESDRGRRIFHVQNDGIYVAGQTSSFGGFFDSYFFKTDLNGNLLFEKNYGSAAYENINDAIMLQDTSFILVGETTNTSNEKENFYLLRINKFGDTLWTKNFGGEGKDIARGISLLNDSTVIVSGEYFVQDSLMQKGALLSLHVNGNVNWLKMYGRSGNYCLNHLTIQNNVIRAVGYRRPLGFPEEAAYTYMLRTDMDGIANIDYNEVHDGKIEFKQIVKYGVDPDDYLFIQEATNSADAFTFEDGSDVIMFNFFGGMYFKSYIGTPSNIGYDICNQAIACSDGGAILVGSNEIPDPNNTLGGGTNVMLVKIGSSNLYSQTSPNLQTLVKVEELQKNTILLSPNPAKEYLNIELKSSSLENYIIRNQIGKSVQSGKVNDNKIQISNLNSGFYVLEVSGNSYKFVKN